MTVQHDISLVVLAGILCAFGSWVTSRLYRHAGNRPTEHAIAWHLLTALTAGISIWGTHFVAMLGFRPSVPVNFDLPLTFASLLIAVAGCAVGIVFSASVKLRYASAIGGAILGLAISGMHYAGMIAYRVRGLVDWDRGYLVASILIAVVFSAVALTLGRRDGKWREYQMTGVLTLAIVSLHFTGMTAFRISPLDISGDYVNPEAFKMLALAIAGTAIVIVMGGLFSYAVENRTRMESIVELTAARNAAESASRAKSEFMSVLSHELRTPLTIVLGYAGILSQINSAQPKDAAGNPVQLHEGKVGVQAELYGQKIGTAANHLLTLINEILDYTSIELGDTKLTRTSFPVSDLLAATKDQFQVLAGEKSIRLHTECDDILVHADHRRLMQILINLVGNAVKFSGASDLHLKARRETDGFRIDVTDNGCGIDGAHIEMIFEAFQQIETADKRSSGGTGLGLAICRKLALAHGGDVTATSIVGEGTTFTLTLPESAIDGAVTSAATKVLGRALRNQKARPALPRAARSGVPGRGQTIVGG
ncbi:ATPase [Pelagovum pacificum]|uniref:histidine kinase n=1 Tax=Pelagovum pacificum TaxID=2588711 RepID=A0A5C5G8N7_9RHOB|nr:ATPase [Pelagovum pacificum]TNY31066.1 ATPase [Pelagovum pacificum]